ncbi:hypothetical protein L1887_34821 [Cichorium endivia]|nr:hypothetical protein L1887_34821 [Cichorium endivia]
MSSSFLNFRVAADEIDDCICFGFAMTIDDCIWFKSVKLGFIFWFYLSLTNPSRYPNCQIRDHFILSDGHGTMLHYALLHLAGYDNVKHSSSNDLARRRRAFKKMYTLSTEPHRDSDFRHHCKICDHALYSLLDSVQIGKCNICIWTTYT